MPGKKTHSNTQCSHSRLGFEEGLTCVLSSNESFFEVRKTMQILLIHYIQGAAVGYQRLYLMNEW